jgi:hypothetical protein
MYLGGDFMASKGLPRNSDEKFLRIRVLSHTGDKVNIKLPIEFSKQMIQDNALDFFEENEGVIDGKKITDMLISAFDYDLTGEIVTFERKNKDIIKVFIG